MPRYIDADKIPRHGKRGGECYWQEIEQLQTADVVEVVRCKDCKHYETDGGALMVCEVSALNTNDDDYCSFGERAEE